MSFSSLGLSEALLAAIRNQGYTQPTPIQQKVIPVVLEGQDVVAAAQTGTGKTAGFTLPLLHRLSTSSKENPAAAHKKVRALILTPTRELANQVGDCIRDYSRHLAIRTVVVTGGVAMQPQIMKLRRGTDIIVATPGRLLDLINQRVITLSSIEIVVLDEADRMLDMGFIDDIRRILSLLPTQCQKLLFSATISREIKNLATSLLKSPKFIEIAHCTQTAARIEQRLYPVDHQRKRELLSHLIGFENWQQVLVFTKTKRRADALAYQLESDGLTTTVIHGNKSQGARNRALLEFKKGTKRVLVATDVAARGIDIDKLPYVVNFDLPIVPEDYVHRIGRTGRAAQSGIAISLMSPDENNLLRNIEKFTKTKLPRVIVPGYESRLPANDSRSDSKNDSRNDSKPASVYHKRRKKFRNRSRN